MNRQDDEATVHGLRMDLLARIGVALLSIQTTERALRLITTFLLQKSDAITAEQIIAQSNAEQKKTLGYFLSELRKRADLAEHFDRTLVEFLRRRNLLVHNLSDLPGWDTGTAKGIFAGRCFINELIEMNNEVLNVFAGLVRAWELQVGAQLDVPQEVFEEIDSRYAPLVNEIFFKKEDQITSDSKSAGDRPSSSRRRKIK